MTTSTSYNVQLDVSNFPESVIENADWKTFRMLLVSELADSLAKDVEYRTRGDMKNKGVQLDKDLTHGIYRYSMKFSTEDGEHRIDVSDIMDTLSSYSSGLISTGVFSVSDVVIYPPLHSNLASLQ